MPHRVQGTLRALKAQWMLKALRAQSVVQEALKALKAERAQRVQVASSAQWHWGLHGPEGCKRHWRHCGLKKFKGHYRVLYIGNYARYIICNVPSLSALYTSVWHAWIKKLDAWVHWDWIGKTASHQIGMEVLGRTCQDQRRLVNLASLMQSSHSNLMWYSLADYSIQSQHAHSPSKHIYAYT